MRAEDLIPGFQPENDLERRVSEDPQLLEGLAWGRPRKAHPEGSVGSHVADLLGRLDRQGVTGEERAELRFIVLVHDAFKNRVQEWRPRVGENHHAMRARRFAERYTDDERLLRRSSYTTAPTASGAAGSAPAGSTAGGSGRCWSGFRTPSSSSTS